MPVRQALAAGRQLQDIQWMGPETLQRVVQQGNGRAPNKTEVADAAFYDGFFFGAMTMASSINMTLNYFFQVNSG